jgi:hypothetical protein
MITDEELIESIQTSLRAEVSGVHPPGELLTALHRELAQSGAGSIRSRGWRAPGIGAVMTTLASACAIAIAAVAITALAHKPAPRRTSATSVPARQLVSMLEVLRRPQTPPDRSLPLWLRRRSTRQAGPHLLSSSVPSLTRLVATLRHEKVFMLVYGPSRRQSTRPGSRSSAIGQREYGVGLLSVSGAAAAGGVGGTPAAALWREIQPGCSGPTDESIVHDGVTRVRWVFARQDQLGFVSMFASPRLISSSSSRRSNRLSYSCGALRLNSNTCLGSRT